LKDNDIQHCLEWGSFIPAILITGIIALLAFSFYYFPLANGANMSLEIGFPANYCYYDSYKGDPGRVCDQEESNRSVLIYDWLEMWVKIKNFDQQEQCTQLVFKDNKQTFDTMYICVQGKSEFKLKFWYIGMPPAEQFHLFEIDGGDYLHATVYIWVRVE